MGSVSILKKGTLESKSSEYEYTVLEYKEQVLEGK